MAAPEDGIVDSSEDALGRGWASAAAIRQAAAVEPFAPGLGATGSMRIGGVAPAGGAGNAPPVAIPAESL